MMYGNKMVSTLYKRRRFLKTATLGTAGLGLIGSHTMPVLAQEGGPAELQTEQVSDSLSIISGSGCNVLVKKAGNGDLLVVDGGLAEHGRQLRNHIRETMDSRRFHTLVNTHWHPSQTGLNEVLGNRSTTIFAHENIRLWLGAEIKRPWEDSIHEPLPKKAQPNESYYHYGEFGIDDTRVQYGYMLQAHTDGDTYIYLPEDNVLHAGGVISNDGWPVVDWWTGGWIGGLVDGIETILRVANEDTLIVPANGPALSYAEVMEMRDMYETIFTRIRELFMDARGPQETLDAKPTAEFDGKWGNSDQFVLLAHQSVLAHFAPDA